MILEKEAFVQRIDDLADTMWCIAYSILRNREDCKDALQETALKAWSKRDSLRDQACFRPWVLRILINECHNVLRQYKRTVPMEDVPTGSVDPPDPTLRLTLLSLPEKIRVPLVMRHLEGMSEREIAQIYHLPESTIRGRIHRAKKMLRRELEV